MWQLHRRAKCAHPRSHSSYCVAVLSPCTHPHPPITHTHTPEAQISGRGGRKDGLIISVAMCWSNTMPDLRNGPGTKPVIIKLCLWRLKPHRRRGGGYSRWLISTLMAKQKHLLAVQVSRKKRKKKDGTVNGCLFKRTIFLFSLCSSSGLLFWNTCKQPFVI